MEWRILLESVDYVFRLFKPGNLTTRNEPVSIKKLKIGDAHFSTRKVLLGWLIDKLACTTPHRIALLQDILAAKRQ